MTRSPSGGWRSESGWLQPIERSLALKLAAEHRAALTQVDDIRLALHRYTSASDDPILHFFLADDRVWGRPSEELRDGLIAIARRLEPALEVGLWLAR